MKISRTPIADLYIRVSTDEQADKGYSQRNQEEMLRRYCNTHSIEVRKIIFEDHSAKTFNRPEWKKLILLLRKSRGATDLILFTKWDRFSRNAADAYQMINTLRGFDVEPQAIEQPLDLSIPENKIMLAFYLAAPEVENDRRALNVFYGMRRARKEGRYMGMAPVGYRNKVDETGQKHVIPNEADASVVRWAFEQIGDGIYNTEQVWKTLAEKGLKCSKNAFWQLIRNPLYCGKIFIPKFKDEESCFVQGRHEAIISEELFEKVQAVLDGRAKKYRTKIETRNDFPLRGFLICPECRRILTASKSKGRNSYYSYYHCSKGCPYRIKAETMQFALDEELQRYIPRKEIGDIFRIVVSETYNEMTADIQRTKKQLLHQVKDYETRIENIRDLLATSKIETSDYVEIKARYNSSLEQLKAKLNDCNASVPSIEPLLQQDVTHVLRLDKIFKEGKEQDARSMISMLYPEKIIFNGEGFECSKMSEVIQHSYRRMPLMVRS